MPSLRVSFNHLVEARVANGGEIHVTDFGRQVAAAGVLWSRGGGMVIQGLLKTRSYAEWLKTVFSEGTSRSVSKWPIARFRFSADLIEYEGWQREDC